MSWDEKLKESQQWLKEMVQGKHEAWKKERRKQRRKKTREKPRENPPAVSPTVCGQ